MQSKTGKPTRRSILRTGLGMAAAPSVAATVRAGESASGPGRTLVLLHLAGGNDGLNTIIPYSDPLYCELRPRLGRVAADALPIDGRLAFHAALSPLVPLFKSGHMAIVQGVGYASPDYSHVGSCRIWASGSREPGVRNGWWDAALAGLPLPYEMQAVYAGRRPSAMVATNHVRQVTLVENSSDVASGSSRIVQTLATIAGLVASSSPPALIFADVGGFDTHADQLRVHAQLLRELGDGLAAFQRTVETQGAAERVILAAWSEFGRRPAENAMGGTDHGSAGPVLVLGKTIRGGVFGRAPSLKDTDFGNLIPTVDFRDVYAMLAREWLRSSTVAAASCRSSLAFV
jgi:uncharacterized protein (DUF1501 family)